MVKQIANIRNNWPAPDLQSIFGLVKGYWAFIISVLYCIRALRFQAPTVLHKQIVDPKMGQVTSLFVLSQNWKMFFRILHLAL